MVPRVLTALVVFACGLAARRAHASAREEVPAVHAGSTADSVHVDGRLDEPAWQAAEALPPLTQQSPRPGEPTPYVTTVRVLANDDTLYVGVDCADPDPSRIAIHTLQRDGELEGDDSVTIVLDTFGDGRTGYLFRTNPAGAQQDGLISGPDGLSLDWDGIWEVKASRTATGWSAEFEIPARSLRFTRALESWGLNVERFVPRDRTAVRWAGATLDASLLDLSRAGRFTGVEGLKQGLGISASPYGLGKRSRDFSTSSGSSNGQFGLDVEYSVTAQLSAVLTVNPDFAETEVDTRQVNLTRFPLFFPEKRSFFNEGSNQFAFSMGLDPDFIPFYSRRVGLFEGTIVPIDYGAKVVGRTGRWGIAALGSNTGSSPAAPETNLSAARLAFDATTHLRLGTILTDGDPAGVRDNSLAGLDAVWRSSTFRGDKNLAFSAWTARSLGDLAPGRHSGWGLKADYPNDLWDLSLTLNAFGDGLDPALGFLPRPGTRQLRAGTAYQPRPDEGGPFGWVRQFFFETFYTRFEKPDGRVESWRLFTAPFNVETQSGEHLEVNWAPQFEYLAEPFEISPGVVIPPGTYRFTRYRTEAQSSPARPWRVGSTVWFGGFYDGRLTQWEAFANWATTSGRLQLGLVSENDFAHLVEGSFIERLYQLSAIWAFTPRLLLSDYTQYDSDSRSVRTNLRLRWTIRSGRDLYVVWNRGWARPIGDGGWSFSPQSDQLVVKLRWNVRA